MSIRECALQSKAFTALMEVYKHREKVARAWRADGKKVIGEMGCDVPDEFLIAAGMLPIHVYADPEKPLKETDTYLEYAFDPIVRAQFEKIVDGTYERLIDALAISNSTDVVIRIYLYLRELHRVEPEKPVPPVEFIDWLFTRNRMHQVRNELTLDIFRKAVEQWAGHPITDEQIIEAAKICNADRQALREMGELRHGEEVRINGSEALVIIGSAFFMEREAHTELVKQVVEDARQWPVLTGPRVFYTGSNQEDTTLYDMIEEKGMVIVGEDHDWGDRYYDRDYNLDYAPIRAVVDRYMLREFSSKKAFVSQRVDALNRLVDKTGADAVIFYTNLYEEAASWDYPSQKKSLEERGIKTAAFHKMAWPLQHNADLEKKLAAFAGELKGGVSNG
ncbi:MAG: 2-hydroxyacyl-CoA dehydratase family protein [Lachnospiraceae bacterium]|nr:2-hydroxyacyl-CoA dehydratase family protein [Lachnospiraceae bacterium]